MTHTLAIATEDAPDDVCHVAGDGGDSGRGHRRRFQDVETRRPVILTTSKRLADLGRIGAEGERRWSGVEELEAVVSANLKRATRLRLSILHTSLSGGLATARASG